MIKKRRPNYRLLYDLILFIFCFLDPLSAPEWVLIEYMDIGLIMIAMRRT